MRKRSMKMLGIPAFGMANGARVKPGALGVGTPPALRTTPSPPGATTGGLRRTCPRRRPPPRLRPSPVARPPPVLEGRWAEGPLPPEGFEGFGAFEPPLEPPVPLEPDPPPEPEPPPPEGGDGEGLGPGTDGIFGGVTFGTVGSSTVGTVTATFGTWTPNEGAETVTPMAAPPPITHAERTTRRVALKRRLPR